MAYFPMQKGYVLAPMLTAIIPKSCSTPYLTVPMPAKFMKNGNTDALDNGKNQKQDWSTLTLNVGTFLERSVLLVLPWTMMNDTW